MQCANASPQTPLVIASNDDGRTSCGRRDNEKKRVAYWLNKRRVAGEPAGIPACSSFA
jgi:hypothetical protein